MTGSESTPKVKVATVWLDGCSGCHMSFLDIDQRLIELAKRIELVYSPLVDAKEFAAQVDLTIVEGAVATDDDLHKIQLIRSRTKILLALGDCAITSNVPSMRNTFTVAEVFDRAYNENAQHNKQNPAKALPKLLDRVRPVHEVVDVDVYVPGCPPPADAIFTVLCDLLAGKTPDICALTRFGR